MNEPPARKKTSRPESKTPKSDRPNTKRQFSNSKKPNDREYKPRYEHRPRSDDSESQSESSPPRHQKPSIHLQPVLNTPGVFVIQEPKRLTLYTQNLIPGHQVYGEKLFTWSSKEYRAWDATRSKMAAALMNKMGESPIQEGNSVLYLGAANGTTLSHLSDIVGHRGVVYAVEFSDRPFVDLHALAKVRKNIIPLLEDARYPDHYQFLIARVDCIYSDVAQPDQVDIVLKNALYFLKPKGTLLLALKLSSIAYEENYQAIIQQQKELLLQKFHIKAEISLEPYHKKHLFINAISRD